jgi:H+/gluconate symporter-like permease
MNVNQATCRLCTPNRAKFILCFALDAGHEWEAEEAAVSALIALVLKLSEARFKPLFLRLLEWALQPSTTPAASTGGGAGLGRLVTFFGALGALAASLRSVLVPYYK